MSVGGIVFLFDEIAGDYIAGFLYCVSYDTF